MVNLLATVAAVTVAITLLAAAAGHARRPSALAGALRVHGVLPSRLARPVAVLVAGVEAALGLAVAAAVLGVPGVLGLPGASAGHGVLAGPALAAAAGLFAAYTAYLAIVRRVRPDGVPCGCAGADVALTGWVVGRAGALAAIALLGWLLAPSLRDLAWRAEVAVALCAGGTFACLLSVLPAAMAERAASSGIRRLMPEWRGSQERHTSTYAGGSGGWV